MQVCLYLMSTGSALVFRPQRILPLKMASESKNYLFNSIEHMENLNGSWTEPSPIPVLT